jgi:WD40 repeat protein
MQPHGDTERVVACCGSDVVAWNPKGASAQQRVFELKHHANVTASAWLGKGRALAVAGQDCVVNIYSVPDRKVVATAPKVHLLPPNAASITCLGLLGNNVAYGNRDGTVSVAQLPDCKVSEQVSKIVSTFSESFLCRSVMAVLIAKFVQIHR